MKETQDRVPEHPGELERVGVTNLRTLVKTRAGYRFVPTIEVTVDLAPDKKGAHMSRLVESIVELVEEESSEVQENFESLCRSVLERLEKKHPYSKGRISLETELVIGKRTPVTNRKTMETHDVYIEVINENGKYKKILKVNVFGNTVCPHSKEKIGKPHIQRAKTELTVETDFEKKVLLEDMVDIVEQGFCSPVYTLLKTPDESKVVADMYDNPKFVEDVSRDVIEGCRRSFTSPMKIRVRTIAEESIHRHDVIAEGRYEI